MNIFRFTSCNQHLVTKRNILDILSTLGSEVSYHLAVLQAIQAEFTLNIKNKLSAKPILVSKLFNLRDPIADTKLSKNH